MTSNGNDGMFWSIIDETISGDPEIQCSLLKKRLGTLDKKELQKFETTYRDKLRKAYDWDLWAAAYIINGGCSDDGFDYFCDWLISRGQKIYEAALVDPETLVGIATPWETEFEEFRYIMIDVMKEIHDDQFPMPNSARPENPSGTEWDEATVEEKFPKIARWVNGKIANIAPLVTSKPVKKKSGLWQRLFGKK